MKIKILCFGMLLSMVASAQNVGVGTTSPAAKLDISSTNSGILIPRVALTSTTVAAPVSSPVASTMIYNTATAGAGATAVTPGFYYWDGVSSAWIRLLDNVAASNNIYNIDGTLTGNRTVTQGTNNLTFGSTSGNFNYTTTGNGSVAMGKSLTVSGANSFATGNQNTASGNNSIVAGYNNMVTGSNAIAAGNGNTASSNQTVAFGNGNTASGSNAFVAGTSSSASGINATSFGASQTASGNNSTTLGSSNIASGSSSMAAGFSNTASGLISMAIGSYDNTTGDYSTAVGRNLAAASFIETALGANNTSYTPGSANSWVATDRLFGIGNGAATSSQSDAMVILKNGNTGIGTATPVYTLDVNGVINAATGFKVAGGTPSTSTYLKGDGSKFVAGSILAADLPSLSGSYVDLITTQTAAGAKTWSGNASFSGGTTSLTNLTSNTITYSTAGVAAPAFTTRSAGTKMVLYPALAPTNVDYALGIDANTMWYSVPQATPTVSHSFFGGTTELMRIRGDGNVGIGTTTPTQKLDVNGIINAATGFKVAGGTPTTSTYLKGDGANFVAGSILLADLPSLAGSYVDLSTAQTAAGAKTWAGNASFNSGTTSLTNPTSNTITYNGTGVAAPAFTTRSAGTKIVLFPAIDASNVDYALGINAGTMWHSVPQATSALSHSFFGGTTELMRIRGDGNVGIGTTTPGQKLEVAGTTKTTNLQMTSGATNGYVLQSDASGNGTWVSPTSITTTHTLTNTANTITSTVNGVAVTAPAVNTVSNTSNANTLITTVNGVIGGSVNMINTNAMSQNGSNQLVSTVNGLGSTALTVASTGDVTGNLGASVVSKINGAALGSTTATSGNLLIGSGTQWVTNPMSGDATISSTGVVTLATSSNNYIKNQTAADQTAGFRVTGNGLFNGGNVGIGTITPTSLLDINDASLNPRMRFRLNNSATGFTIGYNSGVPEAYVWNEQNTRMSFGTNNAYRMVIDATGNVGIGITVPTSKLDVAGNINTSVGFTIAGAATSGNYLRGNGTNFVSSAIQAGDIPSLSGTYVDLVNTQTAAGTKTWSGAASFTAAGTGLAVTNNATVGGTVTVTTPVSASPLTSMILSCPTTAITYTGWEALQLRNNGYFGGATTGIGFYNSTTTYPTGKITSTLNSAGTGGRMDFYTMNTSNASTLRMSLDQNGYVGIGNTSPTNLLTVSATAGSSGLTLTGLTSPLANTTIPMGLNSSGVVVDGTRRSYTTGSVTGSWNTTTGKQVGSFVASGRPYLVVVNATQYGNSGAIHYPSLSYGGGQSGTQVCPISPMYYNESSSHKVHSTSTVYTFPANTTINLYIWTGDSSDTGDSACVTVVEL